MASEVVDKHLANAQAVSPDVKLLDTVPGMIAEITERLMPNIRAASERRYQDAETESYFRGEINVYCD